MLIVIGGLPGTGKTTLAGKLARQISATYLRIDTLEQAILQSGIASDAGPAGYFTGYAVAAENLALGSTVVADSVNALTIVRDSWMEVARGANVPCIEVEIICSDVQEHRRRVEMRKADIPGHKLPSWQDILEQRYDHWKREHIVIDTCALSMEQAVDAVLRGLSELNPSIGPIERRSLP